MVCILKSGVLDGVTGTTSYFICLTKNVAGEAEEVD